jgi:SAM-dependent methyltransferase
MPFSKSLPRVLASGFAAVLAAQLAAGPALGQAAKQSAKEQPAKAAKEEFVPQSGQAGKDVVWVPTPQALVDRMLDMARVTKDDYVIDLGSGDGRTVITAAKRGVKAKGIEYNPDMVALSKRNAEKEGVADKVEFVRGDIFESNFSDATVITLFLLPSLNVRLRPTLLDMKPGTRVVSNTFDMGDWQPDETIRAGGDCTSYCTGHFWVVPAKVDGTWQTPDGELKLEQKYQYITGTLQQGAVTAPVQGKVIGDDIAFTAGRIVFSGEVNGNTIVGSAADSDRETKNWTIKRGGK